MRMRAGRRRENMVGIGGQGGGKDEAEARTEEEGKRMMMEVMRVGGEYTIRLMGSINA